MNAAKSVPEGFHHVDDLDDVVIQVPQKDPCFRPDQDGFALFQCADLFAQRPDGLAEAQNFPFQLMNFLNIPRPGMNQDTVVHVLDPVPDTLKGQEIMIHRGIHESVGKKIRFQ